MNTVFKKWIIGLVTVTSLGGATVTNINLEPSIFNYPLLADKSIEKLEWNYRAQEVLRLEHNEMGRQYREGVITEAQWNEYLKTSFDEKSKWLGYEKSVLRDELGYSTIDLKATSTKKERGRQDTERENFKKSTRWDIKTDKIFVPNRASASVENFTTYTEVDVGSKITVTSAKVDSAANTTQDNSYVYKDMTASHFNGDFQHIFEAYINSSSDSGMRQNMWAMANGVGEQDTLNIANTDYYCWSIGDEGVNILKRLYEGDGTTEYNDTDNNTTEGYNTLFYVKIVRDEAVGTYGTIYSYTYSDSGRTTLLNTQSIALHTSKKDFRYIYGEMNDGRTQAGVVTGYTQNLDLQEAVPVVAQPTTTDLITFE